MYNQDIWFVLEQFRQIKAFPIHTNYFSLKYLKQAIQSYTTWFAQTSLLDQINLLEMK